MFQACNAPEGTSRQMQATFTSPSTRNSTRPSHRSAHISPSLSDNNHQSIHDLYVGRTMRLWFIGSSILPILQWVMISTLAATSHVCSLKKSYFGHGTRCNTTSAGRVCVPRCKWCRSFAVLHKPEALAAYPTSKLTNLSDISRYLHRLPLV